MDFLQRVPLSGHKNSSPTETFTLVLGQHGSKASIPCKIHNSTVPFSAYYYPDCICMFHYPCLMLLTSVCLSDFSQCFSRASNLQKDLDFWFCHPVWVFSELGLSWFIASTHVPSPHKFILNYSKLLQAGELLTTVGSNDPAVSVK